MHCFLYAGCHIGFSVTPFIIYTPLNLRFNQMLIKKEKKRMVVNFKLISVQ